MSVCYHGKRRRKAGLNGHIAESYVQFKLCQVGCSVNSLTVSDYGIDLHIQLPEIDNWEKGPQWSQDDCSMAPLFAHIQVKYRALGRAPVKRFELAEWVDCSKSGVPTYLFIVKDGNDSLDLRYFDPVCLAEKYAALKRDEHGRARKSVSFAFDDGLELHEQQFCAALYMCAKYPLVMQSFGGFASKKEDLLTSFISSLSLGYCIENDLPDFHYESPRGSFAFNCIERLCGEVNDNLSLYGLKKPLKPETVYEGGEFERLDANVHRYNAYPRRCGEYDVLYPSFFVRDNGSEEDAMRGLSRLMDYEYFSARD